MRLYRGLKEPYKTAKVEARRDELGRGSDFTDCPYAALGYAKSRRGVLLVLDVPHEFESRVTEALWPRDDAKRFIVYGHFEQFIAASIPAKELRAELKKKGMRKFSVTDRDRSTTLRYVIERRLAATAPVDSNSGAS